MTGLINPSKSISYKIVTRNFFHIYDDYQIMSLQCSYQRKFINICHFLSRLNDGKCCLSIQTFLPEQIHQIHFESVHNLMKIDIMSNCLVVCNPRSNIIYTKITQHTMAYLYAIHSCYILSIQYNSVFLKTFSIPARM